MVAVATGALLSTVARFRGGAVARDFRGCIEVSTTVYVLLGTSHNTSQPLGVVGWSVAAAIMDGPPCRFKSTKPPSLPVAKRLILVVLKAMAVAGLHASRTPGSLLAWEGLQRSQNQPLVQGQNRFQMPTSGQPPEYVSTGLRVMAAGTMLLFSLLAGAGTTGLSTTSLVAPERRLAWHH